jgi:hypothetical protein
MAAQSGLARRLIEFADLLRLRKIGAQGRDRTTDTAIFSRMLYQLSYLGTSRARARRAPVYSQAGQLCLASC